MLPSWNILSSAVGAVVNDLTMRFYTQAVDPHQHNAQKVEHYAVIGCTDDEIADRYLVRAELIRALYSNELRRGRALHRIGIRQAQWSGVVKQNLATVIIWLGRNVLGQSNNPISETDELDFELPAKNG